MTTRPPAEIGMPLDEVETPALLLDLEAFERNLVRMARAAAEAGVRLRPHSKSHKCPVIALRQMAHGAVGVCCQKVGEAEAMVHGGVPDVLVTNEIVGGKKLARLAALATHARVGVCADNPEHVSALSQAAVAYGVTLPVLVEVNVGADRCGAEPGEPAVRLAAQIAATPGLRFGGLQAYQGRAQHIREFAKRREAIEAAAEKIQRTAELLRHAGLPCESITGAGTGTFRFEAATGLWNEIQSGSYIFMDVDYLKNLQADGTEGSEFEPSLFVLATVMSCPTKDWFVVDAGHKALTVDAGMPWVVGMPDAEYVRAADEHGKITLKEPWRSVSIGTKVRLIPGHCDPTVNLYDWYVGYRGGRVQALWPITARGAVL